MQGLYEDGQNLRFAGEKELSYFRLHRRQGLKYREKGILLFLKSRKIIFRFMMQLIDAPNPHAVVLALNTLTDIGAINVDGNHCIF